jgi:hypothetical protein
MRQLFLRPWLGVSVVVFALVAGCQSSHRHCCNCCGTVSNSVPVVSAAVEPVFVEVVREKKPEIPETVAVTVYAPQSPTMSSAAVAGTVEMNTADAEVMGLRPGYTPGVEYVRGPAPRTKDDSYASR